MFKFVASSEEGSFLIEVTIGGALLAGLALGGATFYKMRVTNQDYLNKLRELDAFHSALTKTLQTSGHCNSTFKPWAEQPQVPGTGTDTLKRIRLCDSLCEEDRTAREVIPETNPVLTAATASPTDNTEWLPISITNINNRQRTWRIRDFEMDPVTRSGNGLINVHYELYPGRPDSRQILKTIMIYFKFTPSSAGTPEFVSCGSDRESSVRSVMQEMCEALNTDSSLTNKFAIWDHESQKCQLRNLMTCPVNTVITGIDSTGEVLCKSLTLGVDGSELYDNNDRNCTGGTTPRIEIRSDGKLWIRCL